MVIPRGTVIEIPVNILQTDPAVWGPDSSEFRPERWLEIDEGKKAGIFSRQKDLFAFRWICI